MSRDPEPFYKSIAEFEGKPHTPNSGVLKIGLDAAYVEKVLDALRAKDQARFNQECADAQGSVGASRPHVSVKL